MARIVVNNNSSLHQQKLGFISHFIQTKAVSWKEICCVLYISITNIKVGKQKRKLEVERTRRELVKSVLKGGGMSLENVVV